MQHRSDAWLQGHALYPLEPDGCLLGVATDLPHRRVDGIVGL